VDHSDSLFFVLNSAVDTRIWEIWPSRGTTRISPLKGNTFLINTVLL